MFNVIMDDRRARNYLADLYCCCSELTVSIISYESGRLIESFDVFPGELKSAIIEFIDSNPNDAYMEIASSSGYFDADVDEDDEPLAFTILFDVTYGFAIHELEAGALE